MHPRRLMFGNDTLVIPAYLYTSEDDPGLHQWRREHPDWFLAGTWEPGPVRRIDPNAPPPVPWHGADPNQTAQRQAAGLQGHTSVSAAPIGTFRLDDMMPPQPDTGPAALDRALAMLFDKDNPMSVAEFMAIGAAARYARSAPPPLAIDRTVTARAWTGSTASDLGREHGSSALLASSFTDNLTTEADRRVDFAPENKDA